MKITTNSERLNQSSMPKNPRTLSPLRYPGGKRWIAPHIERLIELNRLDLRLFVEPFAGGASAALHMLHHDRTEAIGLMDKDPLVAAFWQAVFYDTDWLVKKIRLTPVNLDVWNHLKKKKHTSTRQRAFACIYLNRTSFSGILNSHAGPIGGQSQASKYKIDCRFPRERLADRVDWLARTYRDRVLFVWNWSWKRGLIELRKKITRRKDTAKMLIYFDPPFFQKAERLYNHFFTAREHDQLRNFLSNTDFPWFLSYDDCKEVRDLYRNMSGVSVNSLYTASRSDHQESRRPPSSELVVTNLEANFSEIKFPRKQSRGTRIKRMEHQHVRNIAY